MSQGFAQRRWRSPWLTEAGFLVAYAVLVVAIGALDGAEVLASLLWFALAILAGVHARRALSRWGRQHDRGRSSGP
jgi:membrane protein implicated in regulation of membrane protease activity